MSAWSNLPLGLMAAALVCVAAPAVVVANGQPDTGQAVLGPPVVRGTSGGLVIFPNYTGQLHVAKCGQSSNAAANTATINQYVNGISVRSKPWNVAAGYYVELRFTMTNPAANYWLEYCYSSTAGGPELLRVRMGRNPDGSPL